MTFALILLLFNVVSIPSTFSSYEPNFERDYYQEVHDSGFSLQNNLCDDTVVNIQHQTAACQDLFQRFLYRSVWNVHLNRQAFVELKHPHQACTRQKITWKKMTFQPDWSPVLLICFGQHRPIRTSHTDDDYHSFFFLTTGSSATQLYVFRRIKTAAAEEFVLLDKYTVDVDPRNSMSWVTAQQLEEDKHLNTIETRNFDTEEVEMIYAVDIMQHTEGFEHPMHGMDIGNLITVCSSVFYEIIDLYHGAFIDIDGMFEANQVNQVEKLRQVAFQFESLLPPNAQAMYSCLAKNPAAGRIYNMAVRELFFISPGRRPNSIFAYKQIGSPDVVKLIFYVENFNFKKLKPSHPSETQVRAPNQSTAMDVTSV